MWGGMRVKTLMNGGRRSIERVAVDTEAQRRESAPAPPLPPWYIPASISPFSRCLCVFSGGGPIFHILLFFLPLVGHPSVSFNHSVQQICHVTKLCRMDFYLKNKRGYGNVGSNINECQKKRFRVFQHICDGSY